MKGFLSRYLIGVLIIAGVISACGPSISPTKTAHPEARSRSKERAAQPHTSSVVDRARKATAGRRGTWSLTSEKVAAVADLVSQNARKQNIPEDLLFGIIWVESRFDPRAVSPVGARGLMQLMPGTAKYLADCIGWEGRKNSFDPEFNVTAGSYYIARLIREFKGDENLALAAYNAGPTKVRRWLAAGGLPNVSLEYSSMVQTARTFFSSGDEIQEAPVVPARPFRAVLASADAAPDPQIISDEALDRLGLAILIAGFHAEELTALRQDDENPFN